MGVFYHVQPFGDEMASLLEEMGAAVPASDGPSRYPTPREVREVCAALRGFKTEFYVKPKSHWSADIQSTTDDRGTLLHIEKFKGKEDQPLPVFFEKGSPSLILEILKRLAKPCGPLVVIPDTGDTPIAVTARASIPKLLKAWGSPEDDV